MKQNKGFIDVSSEQGKGATFMIYLPRAEFVEPPHPKTENPLKRLADRKLTVLLVEDERSVLELSRAILEELGFLVLSAETPGQAIAFAENHPGEIHLLLTDVVMPEMNGHHLMDKLLRLRPGIKTLFMSGYSADVVAHHGILQEGLHFVWKPFSIHSLGHKVIQVLDS